MAEAGALRCDPHSDVGDGDGVTISFQICSMGFISDVAGGRKNNLMFDGMARALDLCQATPSQTRKIQSSGYDYVFSQENPRWLWVALNHPNRQILAYAFGRRKDEVFRSFQKLLSSFNITIFYTMIGAVMSEIYLMHTISLERKIPKS